MLVSTNTQLNILVANQTTNNVLKEVLKEADVKTLTNQNKDLNVSTLLKTLFNNIQNSTKSNETVLNLLKNSNLSKDLGSFTSNVQTLMKSLPNDKTSDELKTFLQKFSISPDQATPKDVKEQIQKSGLFLESKLLNQFNNPNTKNENSLLNDMKTVLLKTKAQLQSQVPTQSKPETTTSQKVDTPLQNQTVSKENSGSTELLKQVDKLLTQLKTLEAPNTKEAISKPTLNNEAKPITQQATSNTVLKSDSPILNEVKTLLTKVQTQLQAQVPTQSKPETTTSQKVDTPLQNQSTSQFLQMKVELKAQEQSSPIPKESANTNETLKQIDKVLSQLKTLDTPTKELATKNSLTMDARQTQQINTQIIKSDSPIFNDIKTILTKIQENIKTQIQSQSNIQDDLKMVSSTKDSDPTETLKQVDKLLTQIDYHQLYSIANSSNNIYIPFLWDLLEDGSIDIKKADENKFYCLIDLTLKDLGKINLHLYLYEDVNLDISVFVEKEETKQLIRQKSTALKRELVGTDINLIGLNIFTLKDESTKEDIYKQNDDFDFGVNIKV